MKYRFLVASLLLMASLAFSTVQAQEICDNGIDDDGDGLIDLNDTEACSCSGITIDVNVPSLISNPSFEDSSWVNASDATPDYFIYPDGVWESFELLGLVPFPDGNAVVGTLFYPGFLEYVGNCLQEPLEAGTEYQLTFNIAAFPVDGAGDPCEMGGDSFGDIDIVLYGNSTCGNLPWTGTSCPVTGGIGWEILGSINYSPASVWEEVTITFTPDEDIQAITFGAPCTLPGSYNGVACIPYFVYDNFILNVSQLFEEVPIVSEGNSCEENFLLSTTEMPEGATFQWYQDGVALEGQTDETFDVSGNGYGVGNYELVVSIDGDCGLGQIELEESSVSASFTFSADGFCSEDEIAFTNTSESGISYDSEWDFDDGTPLVMEENPTHSFDEPGSYNVELTIIAGNCQDTESFSFEINPTPDISLSSDPVCEGDNLVIFSESDSENLEYSWSGPGNFSATTNDLIIEGVTVDDSGIYSVTVTDNFGCVNSAVQEAIVWQSTETEVDAAICDGETYLLPDGSEATSAGSYSSVLVSPDTGCDSTIITDLSLFPSYFSSISAAICSGDSYELPDGSEVDQEGQYSITTITSSGCDSITEVDLTVLPFPELALNIDGPFCPGSEVVPYSASPMGGTLFGVHVSDTLLDLTGAGSGSYSASYAYVSSNGCSDTIDASYSILPPMFPEFEYDIQCNTVQFTSTTPDPLQSFNYEWEINEANIGSGQSTFYTISQPLDDEVVLTVVDDDNCISSATQLVQISPEVDFSDFYLPNIITPNGDGANDVLELSIEDPECLEYRIVVMDRWGKEVYDSDKSSDPFSGRSNAGEELSDGVYFYLFESPQINCSEPRFKGVCRGSLTIRR